MVVVDAGEFVVVLVVGYGDGVGVFGIGGRGSHVTAREWGDEKKGGLTL